MKTFTFLLAGFYFFNALACARSAKSEGKGKIKLVINHYKVPCVGTGTQLCYFIQKDNQTEWEFLYEGIEGFQYEWGKIYELEVEQTERKKPKADQSLIAYKLVRIISSKDVPIEEYFTIRVKDADMNAIQKDTQGHYRLISQYPVSCISPAVCEEFEKALQVQPVVNGQFRHASDHQSLVLQSLTN